MYGNAKQHLTIIGDRQSGRTHILALAAVRDGAQGRNVLWECPSMQRAEEAMRDVVELVYETDSGIVKRVSTVNGRYSIEFCGGGQIQFKSPTHRSVLRGASRNVDTHIMDDVLDEPHPDASRVYRALLR